MHRYDTDVVAWANEQAAFIRAGRFDLVDIEHIAEEIEDVGKSERRELKSRMAILLAHLLKWQYQPLRRGNSWDATIRTQRASIKRHINKTPSLIKASLADCDWWDDAWGDALSLVVQETGFALSAFPSSCLWNFDQIIDPDFWPGASEDS